MVCDVAGCDNFSIAKGLCSGHYQQQRKGKPFTVLRRRGVIPATPLDCTAVEKAWLAGLLEGEGCFTLITGRGRTRQRLRVGLKMSDKDVVARAGLLMQAADVRLEVPPSRPTHWRPMYAVCASGAQAEEIMRVVRPYMGDRRGARIDELLAMKGLSHHD